MNNTVQSLWIGDTLSNIERLSIASFLHHGHSYHLYTYNDIDGVPDGAIVKDANEILPHSDVFTYAKFGGYGAFSNWFRYVLIYDRGGYWVDTDVVCLRPFDFEDEMIFGWQGTSIIGNAVIRFPKGSSQLKELIMLCESPNRFTPWDSTIVKLGKIRRILRGNQRNALAHGETGPYGLTNLLTHQGLTELAKPFHIFYPTVAVQWQTVFDETFEYTLPFFRNSYAIHFWSEMMRKTAFDKNGQFHENSLIELLKRQYL